MFSCTNAEDIKGRILIIKFEDIDLVLTDVVTLFLEGLRARSKYVVGTRPYQPAGQQPLLERGDLVRLAPDHNGETLTSSMWCSGIRITFTGRPS